MNNNDKIVIKKRGDDGNRVITIRIKEDLLREIDNIATECNYSRNELICLLLKHGIKNIEIEKQSSLLSANTLEAQITYYGSRLLFKFHY